MVPSRLKETLEHALIRHARWRIADDRPLHAYGGTADARAPEGIEGPRTGRVVPGASVHPAIAHAQRASVAGMPASIRAFKVA